MSDHDDEYDDEFDTDSWEDDDSMPAYQLGVLDLIGIGIRCTSQVIHEVAQGVDAIAFEFFAAANHRREVGERKAFQDEAQAEMKGFLSQIERGHRP